MESNIEERNEHGGQKKMLRSERSWKSKSIIKCMQDLDKNLTALALKHQPLDLPDFYGNINECPLWHAEFNRSTKDRHYSENDNLISLQKCLKGKARKVVRDLFCSPSNVTAINGTLKMNFGREDWIIMNQMDKVRKCPSPREDSIESFLHFSSCVSNMIVLMKNNGCSRYPEYFIN
ncbi:unnamed protein product [Ceutorhynchus assimilis]|uniref:Uncharacterized protein n=1 Tax=Ceutorhynchus assimilis TaxID=467358 RepID=A0A9N9QQR9_9CUCU|nr:unnamed protein product [Ceutorhynchus assimilis]